MGLWNSGREMEYNTQRLTPPAVGGSDIVNITVFSQGRIFSKKKLLKKKIKFRITVLDVN